jgi:uncharacterized DUF497 family protein
MIDDAFEWDDVKAEQNYSKHGIDFELARRVFDDPLAVDRLDHIQEHGEERWMMIGMTGGMTLAVIYTERGGRIRLISARRATRREQDEYFAQNA